MDCSGPHAGPSRGSDPRVPHVREELQATEGLSGSFKRAPLRGDIDIYIDIYYGYRSDMAVSINLGSFRRALRLL